MLRVRLRDVKPGIKLALPVYHPDRPDRLLIRPGVAIEERALDRLREIAISELWIEYPPLAHIAELTDQNIHEKRIEVATTFLSAFDLAEAGKDSVIDFAGAKIAVQNLNNILLDRPRAAYFIRDLVETDDTIARHTANVVHLALLVGRKLDFYLIRERPRLSPGNARDVEPLGLAAFFHEIGLAKIDATSRENWLTNRDETETNWRRHVRYGYELVRGKVDPATAAAVLNHHNKIDGSGFPSRRGAHGENLPVRGRQIHIFSRIIAACDLFERLRNPVGEDLAEGETVYPGEPAPTVRALSRLARAPFKDWIDPVIFRALLHVAPAYPPGAIVTLSDGFRGVVRSWDPIDPCRPTVEELLPFEEATKRKPSTETDEPETSQPANKQGEQKETQRELRAIDLRVRQDLQIAEINGHDVSKDNFYPAQGATFDLAATQQAVMANPNQPTDENADDKTKPPTKPAAKQPNRKAG